jgi:hypothetical protein
LEPLRSARLARSMAYLLAWSAARPRWTPRPPGAPRPGGGSIHPAAGDQGVAIGEVAMREGLDTLDAPQLAARSLVLLARGLALRKARERRIDGACELLRQQAMLHGVGARRGVQR